MCDFGLVYLKKGMFCNDDKPGKILALKLKIAKKHLMVSSYKDYNDYFEKKNVNTYVEI